MSVSSTANQVPAPQHNGGSSNRFHWTVDTFYRAVDAGVFNEPKRLELIKGDLWEKEPLNPPHASGIRRISRLLRRLLEPEFLVDEEKPLRLANDAEPVPDIYVAVGGAEDYQERHPTQSDIRLLIEVADTTVDRDTGEKALLYAQAGIEDYWVYLVQSNDLLVFRSPTREGYRNRTRLTDADIVSPLAKPELAIPVSDLLPRVSQTALVQEG